MATIIIGSNSWVTIAESDIYLDEKKGADSWAALANSEKIKDLITAYRWINGLPNLSITLVTDKLKQAQIETKGLVKMHELLASANMAESMKLGFTPEEFTKLATQSQRIAIKLAEPFDVAFNKLMKGIGRGSIKLLDDLIPGFRSLETINEEYAKILGRN